MSTLRPPNLTTQNLGIGTVKNELCCVKKNPLRLQITREQSRNVQSYRNVADYLL